MNVLVIDVEKHFPPAAKIFPNTDYFAPNVPLDKLVPLQPIPTDVEANDMYGLTPVTDPSTLKSDYDLCIVVWPINSFNDPGYTPDIEHRVEYFQYIFEMLSTKNIKHVSWFDDSDRALCGRGIKWFNNNNIRCDSVFKREYRRTHTWDYQESSVHPFPFMTFGRPNPTWLLYENRVKGNAMANGCFWSGAPINRFEAGVPDEWCNRLGMLKSFFDQFGQPLIPLVMKSGLPKGEFLNQFNIYKCFLHLNGTGHLCGRFFEGLSRDSLMIMQEMDTMFPFQDEMFFHEKCIFERPEDFISNVKLILSDDDLYAECKDAQESILEKYYNYNFMREYILNRIEG